MKCCWELLVSYFLGTSWNNSYYFVNEEGIRTRFFFCQFSDVATLAIIHKRN